jgi:F-type H+-transporting ATPase subunit delta
MSVAHVYAKALFESVQEQASSEGLDWVESQIDDFLRALNSSQELQIALFSPVITGREKVRLVEEISKKLSVNPWMTQFFILLVKKGRLNQLEQIKDSFNSVRLIAEGGVMGRLVAADSMSDSDVGILAKAFSQKLGKKVAFRVSTDPLLLAGMKVTVNGVTYDGSLRSQLQKLRDRFVAGFSVGQA